MARYTLYEIIKDKLSPNTRRRLENQIRFKELTRLREKDNEKEL